MELLAEGVESLKLACSLVLLIPALGIVLFGRRRVWLVATWIVTVTVVAWLRFAGWFTALPSGTFHVAAGLLLVVLAGVAWKRDELAADLAATVTVGFLATWTWVPCVGRELGAILNRARFEPWPQLWPTLVYFVGLFVPLVVLAALDTAWPGLGERLDASRVRATGIAVVALVGGLVSVTLFDDLAGGLARRSAF